MSFLFSGGLFDVIPDNGVLRYDYEDDSNTSTAIDSFENGNDGSINGATYSTTGVKYGNFALNGDGLDDKVDTGIDIASIADANGGFSFATWFYWQGGDDTEEALFGQDNGSGDRSTKLEVNGFDSNQLDFRVYDTSDTLVRLFGPAPSTGTLYFAGGSWDGSQIELLTDTSGTFQSEGTASVSSIQQSSIGTFLYNVASSQPQSFGGSLDRTDFYNKALSSTEWDNLYSTGRING